VPPGYFVPIPHAQPYYVPIPAYPGQPVAAAAAAPAAGYANPKTGTTITKGPGGQAKA